ncbi:Pimeloyl-ACP methyl ester carboxylesterase [Streptomyces sp. DvalAA-14]|uniref:alpha/beta fold hydrolase n=1 Tax=Streptomyces sp. DvalAA-14 TaxID=1839759 RepID=UPI00081B942D|nr:Pimeloyl-ACP methyl ester carboxylesterase [Streptomyces sp. DvalAA-14]
MSTASVNGIDIAYEDTVGSGATGATGTNGRPEVLLVHGHPFDRTMWAPQIAELGRQGVRAVAPDLRGYGETTVVPGVTPLETFAGDLVALLDQLGIGRAVVCGLSMGGQIVLEFYRLFPERVAALVLADTFARGETPDGKRERRERAERLVAEGMAGYAHEVLDKMITPANVADLPDVADHVLAMMTGAPPQGAAAALRGRAERPDYSGMLADIDVPTLVLVGRDDAFTPVGDAEFLRDRIPGARLAVIEGAGHLPNLERPAEFNAELVAHLAALPAGPGGTDMTKV